MTTRHLVAYLLIGLIIALVTLLLARWRGSVLEERERFHERFRPPE